MSIRATEISPQLHPTPVSVSQTGFMQRSNLETARSAIPVVSQSKAVMSPLQIRKLIIGIAAIAAKIIIASVIVGVCIITASPVVMAIIISITLLITIKVIVINILYLTFKEDE